MFNEFLLESATPSHGRRGWTTAASLTLQAAVLSLFALVPLVYPDAISLFRPEPISIPMFSSAPTPPAHELHRSSGSNPTTSAPFIPVRDSAVSYGKPSEPTAPPSGPSIGFSIQGNPLLIPTARGPEVRLEPAVKPKPLALSHMDPGSLIHDVLPVYPLIARQSGTEGVVVLHAVISREGNIESLQVVSGHPFLARAAVEAVRQWRYRPYALNGQPVEVETQITVNFTLGRN